MLEIIRLIIQKPTLARIIKVLDEHDEGITTTELLYHIHLTSHGLKVLKQAEQEKYVEREEQISGKKIINKLTPKGREVARIIRELRLYQDESR